MKLLVVAHGAPSLGSGARVRNYHLLQALSQAHDISLLIVADDAAEETQRAHPLREMVEAVYVTRALPGRFKRIYQLAALLFRRPSIMWRYSPPTAGVVIRRLLRQGQFDAVLFESVITAGHRLPPEVRVIVDEHNLEYELLERSAEFIPSHSRKLHYQQEAAALRNVELNILGRADLALVTSERERVFLSGALPGASVRVIPNGVDTRAYKPDERRMPVPGRIVFTGSMDYHPNEQAALYFAEQCWSRVRAQAPDATWTIVGRNPSPAVQRLASLPGVTVTGTVPLTQPYLAEACVTIAPLLVGSGTRLKLLEALAMGNAVVSTSVGYEGLDLTPGVDLLVADDPAEFAAQVTRLLRDETLRAQLGAHGRETVVRHYSWDHVGGLLLDTLSRLEMLERERHVVLADS